VNLLTIITIAIALAMDAFAVSIASGAIYKDFRLGRALKIAFFFGAFQAIMPLVGAFAGLGIRKYIASFDHWIAFALLIVIGGKMLYESAKIESAEKNFDPASTTVLLVLSIATSIDALAVGLTLSFLKTSVLLAASIIGAVTFLLSYIGVAIGSRFGHFFENKIEAAGGLILIAIAFKILIEHTL